MGRRSLRITSGTSKIPSRSFGERLRTTSESAGYVAGVERLEGIADKTTEAFAERHAGMA